MNKAGLIFILIALNLFSFTLSECFMSSPMPTKTEDCTSRILDQDDKDIGTAMQMTADTCCMIVSEYQGVESKVCYPVEKSKASDYKNTLKKYGSSFANADMSIKCSSSYIKYGISILMILLLN